MSVNVLLSEDHPASRVERQRAMGKVAFSAQQLGGVTRPLRIAESGSMRVRIPRGSSHEIEAVLVNTAGGIACGDRFDIAIEAGAGSAVVVTTPAAEKVYRSDGPLSTLSAQLNVGDGARLEWLPQETILYDQARLERRLDARMSENASLCIFEAVVFGRAARQEIMQGGLFIDRWSIIRGSRVVYADTFKLEGAIARRLERPSVARGARALATFLYVGPDAESRLHNARTFLASDRQCEGGASAWNGILAARFCAVSIEALRKAATRFLVGFRGKPLPRVWSS